jgi:hypothetical protein
LPAAGRAFCPAVADATEIRCWRRYRRPYSFPGPHAGVSAKVTDCTRDTGDRTRSVKAIVCCCGCSVQEHRPRSWGTDWPADEDEARERLLAAADACYAEKGPVRTRNERYRPACGASRLHRMPARFAATFRLTPLLAGSSALTSASSRNPRGPKTAAVKACCGICSSPR